jgi:hypothetical protein
VRRVVERYAPPSMVLNEDGSSGPITSRRPGRASVIALLPPARVTGKSK